MMTRWEYESLLGEHGADAKHNAERSWGRYLGTLILLHAILVAVGFLGITAVLLWRLVA